MRISSMFYTYSVWFLCFFPSMSLYVSVSQVWCLCLRLCAPVMNTPTPCFTWIWARTLGSSQGTTPRLESMIHPETGTLFVPFRFLFFHASLMWCLFCSSAFLFAEPVSVLVPAQLPGPLGSVRHRLLYWLCEWERLKHWRVSDCIQFTWSHSIFCSYLGLFWGGAVLIFPFWIFPKILSRTG